MKILRNKAGTQERAKQGVGSGIENANFGPLQD